MPLYRYECESCSNQFTVLVRQQAQADVPVCPECGSKETRRMVPRVAVQFKGSGYYKTDYAGKGRGNYAEKRSEDKEPNGSTETKPSADSNPNKGTNDSQSGSSESSKSQSRNAHGSKPPHNSASSPTPNKTASAR